MKALVLVCQFESTDTLEISEGTEAAVNLLSLEFRGDAIGSVFLDAHDAQLLRNKLNEYLNEYGQGFQ